MSMKHLRNGSTLFLCAAYVVFQLATAPNASAGAIFAPNLSTFALLGGAGVAINGTGSVLTGSIGGCCGSTAVTGVSPTNFTDTGGTIYNTGSLPTATETLAQGELGAAITALSGMTATPEATLNNITLGPNVYSIGATTLTGTLTLDGGGNANALWVFLESSTLTTASGSNVIVQGTGAGAGVFWVMTTASAILGSGSTFEGNILANQSISAGTGVTDSCGRLLTQVASVTLAGTDTIGIGCSGALANSNGLSGGGTLVNGVIVPSQSSSAVPEPSTFFLLAPCLAALVIQGKWSRSKLAPSHTRSSMMF